LASLALRVGVTQRDVAVSLTHGPIGNVPYDAAGVDRTTGERPVKVGSAAGRRDAKVIDAGVIERRDRRGIDQYDGEKCETGSERNPLNHVHQFDLKTL